jgi:hypothetical protein
MNRGKQSQMIPIKTIKIFMPRRDFESEDQESKVWVVVQALSMS